MEIDLTKLCDYGIYKTVKKGDVLYKEKAPVDGVCYLVINGKLEEHKAFTEDNAFIREISSGDVAGILELFSNQDKRITTLKAVENSKLYMWNIDGLKEIATSNLQFCLYLIRNLSTTLRGLDFELKELFIKKG
jgi:CRP-like cAMP-binding protein